MLLSVMLIAVASLQSLHSELDHVDDLKAHCEFCITAQGLDDQVLPIAIALPAAISDAEPALLLAVLAPSLNQYRPPARAPPAS